MNVEKNRVASLKSSLLDLKMDIGDWFGLWMFALLFLWPLIDD